LKQLCNSSLPDENSNSALNPQLSASYRNLHHSLVTLLRLRVPVNISKSFLLLQSEYNPLYFRTEFDSKKLALSFERIDEILNDRITKAKIYKKNLVRVKGIRLLDQWETSHCCWRFSFLLQNDEKLVEFSEKIRNKGYHLSNLYWPVNHFFNPEDKCPNADYFGRRIINTWVDSSVSTQWVMNCSQELVKQLSII